MTPWDRVKNHHISWSEPRIEGGEGGMVSVKQFDLSHVNKKDRAFLIIVWQQFWIKIPETKNTCKQFWGNNIVSMDHHHRIGMLGKQDCFEVHKKSYTSRCIGKNSPIGQDTDCSHLCRCWHVTHTSNSPALVFANICNVQCNIESENVTKTL